MNVTAGIIVENNGGQDAQASAKLWVIDDSGVYSLMSYSVTAPPGTTKSGLATAEVNPGSRKRERIDLLVMGDSDADYQIYSIDVTSAEATFNSVMDGFIAYGIRCQYRSSLFTRGGSGVGVVGPTSAVVVTALDYFRSGSSRGTYYLEKQSGSWVVTRAETSGKC